MRWPVLGFLVGLPVYAGWMLPGSRDVGVLSCTVGPAIDTRISADTPAGAAREMLCSFKPHRNGAEETYSAVLRSVSADGAIPEKATLLWMVKASIGIEPKPGLLQQSYAGDPATPPGQATPLIGERNEAIFLQPMNDKEEGSASREKQPTPKFVVMAVELVLKASIAQILDASRHSKSVAANASICGSSRRIGHYPTGAKPCRAGSETS